MEKNISYLSSQVASVTVKLAWGQLDMIADDTQTVQVLVAGEDQPVQELRIALEMDWLHIEQPQYGLSTSVLSRKWLQVCVRLPQAWCGDLELSTITGMLSAGRLRGNDVRLDSITGGLHVSRLRGGAVSLRTISGSISGDRIEAESLALRTVSGTVSAGRLRCPQVHARSLSGAMDLHFAAPFNALEVQSLSGTVTVVQPSPVVQAAWKTPLGKQLALEGVTLGEEGPAINATSLSGKLTVIRAEDIQGGDDDGQRGLSRDAGRQHAAADAPGAEDAAADGSAPGNAGREGI